MTLSQVNRKKLPSFRLVGGILLTFLTITSLKADEWAVDANIQQSLSYDDNVTLRAEAEDSFIYNITPIVNFYHRTELSELTAHASYGYQHFFDISTFNREHQDYGIEWQYLMDRFTWGLDAEYSIAPGRDTAEQDSGNFETDSEKTHFFLSPSVSYQLTSIDRVSLSASYSDDSYSSGNFSDSVNESINLSWSHQWTERLSNSVSFFYSIYDSNRASAENPKDFRRNRDIQLVNQINRALNRFDGLTRPVTLIERGVLDIETISYGVNFSTYYTLSEKWQLFGTLGGRFSESENVFEGINQGKESTAGFLVDVGFNYVEESLSAEFSINRALIPSAEGRLNEQSRYSLELDYHITERLSAAMLVSYQESEQLDDDNSIQSDKRTNIEFSPSISWKLDPDWTVSTSYRYHWQERPIGGSTEAANSNLFTLSVNYNWPGLNIAR